MIAGIKRIKGHHGERKRVRFDLENAKGDIYKVIKEEEVDVYFAKHEGETDKMLAPTVTARKKNRPRPSADDDSEDDYKDLPTTAKKKRTDMTDYHPGKARRNINGALQAVENKAIKITMVEPKTDVVSILLQAHMESKKYINSANCFEKQTVLELINKGDIMKESIQDMAFVLDSAVSVYTIRVDRTHGLTMAVKSNVNHGMNEKEPGAKASDEVSTREAREAKKHAAKQMLGDWKSKFDATDGERDLPMQSDEEEGGSDSDDSEAVDETGEEKWLSRVPASIDDFDDFLKGMIHHRRQKNAKLNTINTFLTDDGDVLNDRTAKNLDTNEYYHKAVSRHGEGTIASLLMNNAKCTSDGKAYLLHSRIEEKIEATDYDERVPLAFLRGVEATLSNALAERPVRVKDDLLPPKEILLEGRDSIDSDDDEPATVRDIDAPSTVESLSDETMMQLDHTIADTTMMPNTTILNPSKIVRRKTAVFRGRNMDHMWIPDTTDLGITESIFKKKDELDFIRIINWREKELPNEARGRVPVELTISDADFRERTLPVEISGIADELRDLDCIWNAQIVAREVTQMETEEMLRRAEDMGGSEEEIRTRKKRILPPGNYIFFMEPVGDQNPIVPVDQWADEGTEAADIVSGGDMDVFFDANDDDMFGDGGGMSPGHSAEDLIMDDDNSVNGTDDEEKAAQAVRAVMEQNNLNVSFEPPALDAPSDDIADVPVNPGAVIEAPDEVLRNMGKEDDAHWKGNKPEEAAKKDRVKKEKKNEERPVNIDDYFAVSNDELLANAIGRFKTQRVGILDKDEKMLFLSRKNIERRPHMAFNYEDFVKPGLTTGSTYHGMIFEKTDGQEQRYNTVNDLLANEEESNVDDIVGREWMALFSGLILREKQEDDETSFHSTANSMDGQENEDEMEPEDDGAGANYDDDDVDDKDSFHSAIQHNDFGSDTPMDMDPFPMPEMSNYLKKKSKNAVHELHEIQREDHDEEDQGEFVYIMDRKVCIKNTTIDQSKTKNCIKSVLVNEMMDLKALEIVAMAEESYEKSVLAGEPDRSILEAADPLNESYNPLDVTKAIFGPVDEQSQVTGSQLKHASDGDSLSNAVVLSDFNIKGTHSMASLMACLPFRAQRLHEKNMHVSLAFSIALQMCNENTLKCVQKKECSDGSGKDEDWMGDFILQNAVTTTASASFEDLF